ncbi:MAG: hypothetical protein ACK5JU_04255 [Bacteroidales bacterium]
MKIDFSAKWAKAAIDLLMILFFLLSWLYSAVDDAKNYWTTSHCTMGFVWIGLMSIHLFQHGRFALSLKKKSVVMKNKITTLTLLFYLIMIVSISLFLSGFPVYLKELHHFIGHLFVFVVIIHMIQMWKRFLKLFPRSKQNR